MKPINYEITNNLTFPFNYGIQHFKESLSNEKVEWKGRAIHLIVCALEMIPLINYIIAIADRILHPKWLWELATSEIDFDKLPVYDQSDIDLPDHNVTIPGIGIGVRNIELLLPGSCEALQAPDYKWFQILEEDDFKNAGTIARKRNNVIINRTTKPIMKGVDPDGNPMLLLSRPTTRPAKVNALLGKYPRTYKGNEVSIIFKNGTCINMCSDSLGDCFSKISRLPEASPGLIDSLKKAKA